LLKKAIMIQVRSPWILPALIWPTKTHAKLSSFGAGARAERVGNWALNFKNLAWTSGASTSKQVPILLTVVSEKERHSSHAGDIGAVLDNHDVHGIWSTLIDCRKHPSERTWIIIAFFKSTVSANPANFVGKMGRIR